jgi:cytochrome c2
MIRKLAAGIILAGFILASWPAQAGGWAVLTLDAWPDGLVVNKPADIGFNLRQHGQHLLPDQDGKVIFDNGRQRVEFEVFDAGPAGHYTATVALPTAGVWRWRIVIFGEHELPAVVVHQRAPAKTAARMTTAQQAALGKTLFVAKGCWMCHEHQAIAESGNFKDSYGVGGAPNLTRPRFDSAYLHAWLKDPKAVKPKTLMPNLSLKKIEIDALTAFLTQRR